MLFCFKRGVWVRCCGLHALGTAIALQTARVGVLYGGHGVVSTRSGLLSAGVGVRWVVAGSLPNGVSVQSGRVSIMCGGAGCWASTTVVLYPSTVARSFLKTVFLLPHILPSPPPIEMADKQEK